MKKTIFCTICSILFGLASWGQLPKADVVDIVFNDDGTIIDASPMQNPVTVMGLPRIEKSTQLEMNVLCQSDEYWGHASPNYVRIDRNEKLDAAIGDGVTMETLIRPYFQAASSTAAGSTFLVDSRVAESESSSTEVFMISRRMWRVPTLMLSTIPSPLQTNGFTSWVCGILLTLQ